MISQETRRKFLQYFKGKGHTILPSSSVVPHEDPTLLFTNAGMNQFKDVFLGKSERDYRTAATSQKCIRVGGKHNDLDNVGHTTRHMTFFEMLGNFSFGDYFKEKAIAYAWEVSTQVFSLDPQKIWVTIYEEDDEAFELWKKWAPIDRIVRMGEKDNFWAMGDTGPCGPCSELLYDRGAKFGTARNPKEDASGERYLEFWNLVFMQYNRSAAGKLDTLPKQSIDTGAGLERVVSLRLGVDSVFATDILRALIAEVEKISRKSYNPEDARLGPAFHVIADHIRSLSFAIADGAQPSNIERGYVLRKLLRRAVRYGRMLDLQDPFLAHLLPCLIDLMGDDYPELRNAKSRIAEILTLEEEGFIRTLKRGGNILNSVIEKAAKNPHKQITGEEAFKLKDTYGFPLEEIVLIAKDTGLSVNIESYQILEEKAKEISRSAQETHNQVVEENLFQDFVSKHGPCRFLGYTESACSAKVVALVKDGQFVPLLAEGEEGMVILDQTPFYPEKGGQVADTGTLTNSHAHFLVTGCHSPFSDVIVHIGKLERGTMRVGLELHAAIDLKRREEIAHHHTATHLLHWALQEVLGPHIRQAGSLVEPTRLRFDFNHHKPLSPEEIERVEDLVNEKIAENRAVQIYELTFDEVQKRSDIKQFFGEKYGARVRVIDIDYSKELCGGTHVHHLGVIGLFRIMKESSIAAGVRRIEACTGHCALAFSRQNEKLGEQAAALLKTSLASLPEKLSLLLEESKQIKQQLKNARRDFVKTMAREMKGDAEKMGSFSFLSATVALSPEELNTLAEELQVLMPSSVAVLGSTAADKAHLIIRISSDLVKQGMNAATMIKEVAPLIGGSGGGKPEGATAGGKNPSGLPDALKKARSLLAP